MKKIYILCAISMIIAVAVTLMINHVYHEESHRRLVIESTAHHSHELVFRYRRLLESKQNVAGVELRMKDMEELYGNNEQTWPTNVKESYRELQAELQKHEQEYNKACNEYQTVWDIIFEVELPITDLPRDCKFVT